MCDLFEGSGLLRINPIYLLSSCRAAEATAVFMMSPRSPPNAAGTLFYRINSLLLAKKEGPPVRSKAF